MLQLGLGRRAALVGLGDDACDERAERRVVLGEPSQRVVEVARRVGHRTRAASGRGQVLVAEPQR